MAKRCNAKRTMAEAVRWGSRGDFYKNMFAKCPAGRPGTADEVAALADFLVDCELLLRALEAGRVRGLVGFWVRFG